MRRLHSFVRTFDFHGVVAKNSNGVRQNRLDDLEAFGDSLFAARKVDYKSAVSDASYGAR